MPISSINRPRLLITMGDPSGVGPEVVVKALAGFGGSELADFFVIGDGSIIEKVKKRLGLRIAIPVIDLANVPAGDFSYGLSKPSFGRASIEYIDKALEILNKKEADALVTAPVNKFSIRSSGITRFSGHTEYLAMHTAAKDYAMMFVGKDLKITVVTRHIPLRDVPGSLSGKAISKTILTTHTYLKKYFRLRSPRIGVAGLNPHAGERGLLGDEESRLITPTLTKLSKKIKGIYGPIPPDVVFYEALNKKYDAVVAMYHDQGLIPFKMLYFKNGVNLTLGLPFIRTSPDHGTAFNIAGTMTADPSSMIEAISLACRLAGNRPKA